MTYHELLIAQLVGGIQEAFVASLIYELLSALKKTTLSAKDRARLGVAANLDKASIAGLLTNHRQNMSYAVRAAFREALEAEDKDIVGVLSDGLGARPHLTNLADIIADQVAKGMQEIIDRQNIALVEQAEKLWYEVTAEALARVQSGDDPKKVLEECTQRLLSEGLSTIDYVSGVKTSVQAALQRHIVTQANQARNRLLLERMAEWGHDLVFTSAHFGARPPPCGVAGQGL